MAPFCDAGARFDRHPAYRSPFAPLPEIGADLGQLRQLPWLVTGFMIAVSVQGPVCGVQGVSLTSAVLFSVAPYEPGTDAGALLSGTVIAAPETLDGWRAAFVAAFGSIALRMAGGWLMAMRNPMPRVD